jgi:hypothetical protein
MIEFFTPSSNRAAFTTDHGAFGQSVILEKFSVDTLLLEHVRDNFNDILPSLLEDVEYTDEDLVGAALWADWTPLGQRLCHLCLKHLALQPEFRLIDLAFVKPNKTTFHIAAQGEAI